MGFINWDELPEQIRGPGRYARLIKGEQLTVVLMVHEGPMGHELHRHDGIEQVIYVLDGQVEYTVADEVRILQKGDAVIIPPGVAHKTRVNPGEKVVSLKLFSSPQMKKTMLAGKTGQGR